MTAIEMPLAGWCRGESRPARLDAPCKTTCRGGNFEAGPWDQQLEQFNVHALHIDHRTLAEDNTATRESRVDLRLASR